MTTGVPATLPETAAVAQQAAEEQKRSESGSPVAEVADGVVDLVTSGAVELAGNVLSATVEGIGTVASGVIDVAGGIIGGLFEL